MFDSTLLKSYQMDIVDSTLNTQFDVKTVLLGIMMVMK